MRPSISRSHGATIRRHSIPLRPGGIRAPTIVEILACHSTHPSRANNVSRSVALVDVDICVSSVAPLTICWRSNVPALLERLADFSLRELFLFRPIFARVRRLPMLDDKLSRPHETGIPTEVE